MPDYNERASVSRREFLRDSAAAALAMTAPGTLTAQPRRLRVAIVGTGSRGTSTWGKPVAREFADVVEIVGLCDINGKRAQAGRELIGVNAPAFQDFDQMIRETKPDSVIVTTVDATHWRYIVRAVELGCDAITEKPMCTDEAQCRAILDAQKKTGRSVRVTFNARHSPDAKRVKQLLLEKAAGDVLSVDFHEYLDTSHGASYFRRWHHLKENSGTLLVHKASHHFDQANWWLDAQPVEVSASGELRFYGKNGPYRGTHCRACPYRKQCPFYWDIRTEPNAVKLYAECESEDGYLRDACVWRENTNIYDVMSVRVKYENGVLLTYTANTYLPLEGQQVSINGTRGRIDLNSYGGGGHSSDEIRLTRSFGKSEALRDIEPPREGGHGGADAGIRELMFRKWNDPDPLGLKADLKAGALASLIGIAAYRSIERGGAAVKISELANV
jgi:predicted dehydrogenase